MPWVGNVLTWLKNIISDKFIEHKIYWALTLCQEPKAQNKQNQVLALKGNYCPSKIKIKTHTNTHPNQLQSSCNNCLGKSMIKLIYGMNIIKGYKRLESAQSASTNGMPWPSRAKSIPRYKCHQWEERRRGMGMKGEEYIHF